MNKKIVLKMLNEAVELVSNVRFEFDDDDFDIYDTELSNMAEELKKIARGIK